MHRVYAEFHIERPVQVAESEHGEGEHESNRVAKTTVVVGVSFDGSLFFFSFQLIIASFPNFLLRLAAAFRAAAVAAARCSSRRFRLADAAAAFGRGSGRFDPLMSPAAPHPRRPECLEEERLPKE